MRLISRMGVNLEVGECNGFGMIIGGRRVGAPL